MWTGLGQHVDISATDVMGMMILGYQPLTTYFDTGETQKRSGYVSPYSAPCALLPCKDGYVYLAALNLKQWTGLRKSMDEPEWADNALFNIQSPMERMQYGEEIYQFLTPWLLQHTKEELFALCQSNGTPVTPAYNMADLAGNAHLAERNFFVEVPTAAGRLKVPGAPFKMSATPWRMRKAAPRLGENDEQIFCGRLGLTRGELADLRRGGII
jgi:crotonobetainyl-CoA:carnitine CoA-transferase CaiB-like acyl-CoA transferase